MKRLPSLFGESPIRWPRLTAGRRANLFFALGRPWSVWAARKHLRRVQRQLKKYDVQKVLNLPVEKPPAIDPDNTQRLYRLAARTLRDCRCLPQSVAVFQNLKSRGIPARHVIGINKKHRHGQSLSAHAWVETGSIE